MRRAPAIFLRLCRNRTVSPPIPKEGSQNGSKGMPLMEAHSISLSGATAGKRRLLGGKQLRFLATKVVPPRCPGLIDRPRLLAMASRLPAKRLAVIKAPAGFGKTSLAVELVRMASPAWKRRRVVNHRS